METKVKSCKENKQRSYQAPFCTFFMKRWGEKALVSYVSYDLYDTAFACTIAALCGERRMLSPELAMTWRRQAMHV